MLLDSLATRYGLLPSEVLHRADTLDVMVMDVAISYQQYQSQRQERGGTPVAPNVPINRLQEMLERVKR